MNSWQRYKTGIRQRCSGAGSQPDELRHWRNILFADMIICLLPLCGIALIPGMYWSIHVGLPVLAVFDLLALCGILLIAFHPRMQPLTRKKIFIVISYTLAILLIYYVGLPGPGLIYLFAACIFGILVFPVRYAWQLALANTLCCLGFALVIPSGLLPWPSQTARLPGEWIAVTSNLVFLSWVSALLIPRLFKGWQSGIAEQQRLARALQAKQEDLNQALESLKIKNSELEQFAYVASHDLKEPLRMINGFMQLLRKKYEGQLDETAAQYIHFASDGASRMNELINTLLDYARAGENHTGETLIDIDKILHEITALYQGITRENEAQIRWEKMPQIYAPETPLRQLLQNLIGNALKYQPPRSKPVVEIRAAEESGHWVFYVMDNGIGIAQEQQEKIFRAFHRLHSKQEYPGTGIGLALCRKIVESWNGIIGVQSAPGEGATFYFTVPKIKTTNPGT